MSHLRTNPLVGVVAVLLVTGLAYWAFAGGYGEVNGQTYEYAKALYSVCNRHDDQRLSQLSEMIESSRQKSEVSEQEAEWLMGLISEAREGHWEVAAAETRRLMEDQIRGR
jgi:hypothetical protein